MWQGPWRCGWQLFVASGRAAVRALQYLSAVTVGMFPDGFDTTVDPPAAAPRARPAGPPPGHPERVRPDVPPTELERLLWAQLRWPEDGSPSRTS